MMRKRMIGRPLAWAVMAACLLAMPVHAHETDQFSVPVGEEMADMGPFVNDLFVERLELAVSRLNARIDRALNDVNSLRTLASGHGPNRRAVPARRIAPQDVLDTCHSPDGVAEATWQAFGSAVDLIEYLNTRFHSDELAKQHPGKLCAYRATDHDSIYNGLYFPLDPRTAFRLYHATSFKCFDVYLGSDKIGHFTDMGYHYFRAYRKGLRKGESSAQAMQRAAKLGVKGLFSEKGLLGYVTAGAYSNADVASNYVGCLFYRNLTEPVLLKGELRPPMLERDGEYWKLADFVTEDPRFLERFISDHFDEALNPSLFGFEIRSTLRPRVAKRRPDLLQWYGDRYGDRDPDAFFQQLMLGLSTYYGADYGHSESFDKLVGLWEPDRK